MKNKTEDTPDKNLQEWLDSSKGQQAVLDAVKEGIRISEELSESRRIKPEVWCEPFTV